MEMLHAEARDILAHAGARVDGERVRIGREIVEHALTTPPAEFTIHARNPAYDIRIGGKWIAFGPVGGPPNCSDLDRGRRPGTLEDNGNFMKLCQFFNCIHTVGDGSVDALDVHASVRHLHIMRNKVRFSDKVPFVYSTGRARLLDSLEITRLARGISRGAVPARTLRLHGHQHQFAASSSTIRWPWGSSRWRGATRSACVTPFTLLGAMAPVTLAGALVEQNAEALACLALSQLARPGAPFVYGGFTSNVDMKSGAPAFGTPEYMKACIIGGQLARRYRLPYRTSSTNAANSVDAQAAYETVFSLWGAIMGGGNLIVHAAGWMEGGLTASYEKFALDVDLLQMVEEFLKPLTVDEGAMALDAMHEVGPGGHFFGAKHTLERYATAFYQPHDLRLAQLQPVAGGRLAPGGAEGKCSVEAGARGISRAPSRPGDRRGDRRLCRSAYCRRRRGHRFLAVGGFRRSSEAIMKRAIDGQAFFGQAASGWPPAGSSASAHRAGR